MPRYRVFGILVINHAKRTSETWSIRLSFWWNFLQSLGQQYRINESLGCWLGGMGRYFWSSTSKKKSINATPIIFRSIKLMISSPFRQLWRQFLQINFRRVEGNLWNIKVRSTVNSEAFWQFLKLHLISRALA